jgi:hypothetical protein
VSAAEYAGMMEQVALTIDSELRKDAGLPPAESRSVLRRVAAQKGEPVPDFSHGERIDDAPYGLSGEPQNMEPFRPAPSATSGVPWIGGNRNLDPNNPEDVAAWKERDQQAAAMLEPSHLATNVVYAPPEANFPVKGFTEEPPKVDPAAFEFLDETRKAADMACGADPAVLAKANSDPHAKSIAGHSHVLSSADPKPRIADTSMEMPKPKMIDSPKTAVAAAHEALAKKKPAEIVRDMQKKRARKCKFCEKPLERWSATMMRCTGCGRNEAV